MKRKRTDRWLLLMIAFFVSCMIWYMVISRENPRVMISLGSIEVNIKGGSTLHENGLAYYVEGYSAVNVSVDISQKKAVLVSMEDISLSADISDCVEGEYDIPIDVNVIGHKTIIGNSYSLKHGTIKVRVEKLESTELSVDVETTGMPAAGYTAGNPCLSQSTIKAKVPKSLLDSGYTAYAQVDISGASSQWSGTPLLSLVDAQGLVVNASNLQIVLEQDTVDVVVPIGQKKSISIELPETDTYKTEGYYCDEISGEASSITVIGPESVIEGLSSIRITPEDIELSQHTEGYSVEINLKEYLPDSVTILNSLMEKYKIIVNIQPYYKKTIKVDSNRIEVLGLPKDMTCSFVSKTFTVTITGKQEIPDSFSAADLSATLIIKNLNRTNQQLRPTVTFVRTEDDGLYSISDTDIGTVSISLSGS